MKLCPQCAEMLKSSVKFCPVCGYSFFDSVKDSNEFPVKIVLLTVVATLGIVGLAFGFYYLGIQSQKSESFAQSNNASLPLPLPSAISTQPISNAINTNQPQNSNTVYYNKTVKKQETNANTQAKEKKRSLSDASSYDWTYFSETNNSPSGYYYFYKPNSISGTITVEVWTRKYPMYPKGFAAKNGLTAPVDYVLEKIAINCKEESYRVESQSFFDSSGSSIEDKRRGFYTYQSIVPETTMETLKNRVCI